MISPNGHTAEQAAESAQTTSIPTNLVDSSPYQPRHYFDPAKLQIAAENIDRHGLLNPIIVRAKGHRYELIGGERRLRTVRDVLEREYIDAKIISCTDQEAAVFAAIDNVRSELLPTEKAQQVVILREQGISYKEIATMLGYSSENSVHRLLWILDTPEEVQQMLDKEKINESHIPVIRALAQPQDQIQAADMASRGKLTVHQLKSRTQHMPSTRPPREPTVPPPVKPEQLNQSLIRVQQDIIRLPERIWPGDKKVLLMHITHTQQALTELEQKLRNS